MRLSYKWGIVIVALALAGWGLAPTLLDALSDYDLDRDLKRIDPETGKEVKAIDSPMADWVMKNGTPLTLGLDLQGGLLLQYKVLLDKAVQDKLDRMAQDVEARLEEKLEEGMELASVEHPDGSFYIEVEFGSSKGARLLDTDFMANFTNLEKVDKGGGTIRLVMSDDYIDETKEFAVEQAVETIRQRVNSLGVTEPSITRRGESDIVVQLPGLKEEDQERAKELIGQTAKLRFRLVDDKGTNDFFNELRGEMPTEQFKLRRMNDFLTITHSNKNKLEDFFKDRVGKGHILGYEHVPVYKDRENKVVNEKKSFWKSYYIFEETRLSGDRIQNAQVSVDQRTQRPVVSLTLDRKGATKFHELTKKHVDERFAIMLDDEVQSAPVINEPIPGGRAQISMGTLQSYSEIQQEAQDLVIVLRHGALPAPIELQYQTVVGPTLGQESIESSTRALLLGSLLIILFMFIYYRKSGGISVFALLFNMMFIMAGLAGLGATLTLPGIAGIILTVGMAVDANVIIYERIREEYRSGANPKKAVSRGFEKALSAVMDANVTTGIAALVLLQYGTGPIRGFAVTLLIGIISTIFTAVFISRMLFDTWLTGKTGREAEESFSI